jgi:hypothetical protein
MALVVVLVGSALLAPASAARASVPRGDPAARLPERPFAGDYWDLVARFESGHAILAIVSITNLGPAGRHAAVVGQVIEPDGTAQRFSRSETAAGFQLASEGRRVDLRSIVLDQSGATRRFRVDKDELEIDLVLTPSGSPLWPEDAVPGCPLDVLETAAPAAGWYRRAGRERVALRGRAALTHRWTPGLEADCMQRGVELFVLEGELSLYFQHVLAPDGRALPWLVVRRGGRLLYRGIPSASELSFRPDGAGFPDLAAVRFDAPGVSGRLEFGAPLGRFEPLARLPSALRWVIGQRTQPRLSWSAPHFEITLGDGAERRTFAGAGLAKIAYTNPLWPDVEDAGPVSPAPAPEPDGGA